MQEVYPRLDHVDGRNAHAGVGFTFRNVQFPFVGDNFFASYRGA